MRSAKHLFVGFFFALSVFPAAQWAFGIVDYSALQEKRPPAPVPDVVVKILHGDGRLAVEINRWFDDRYGFRPLLVRLKNQLDYWLFRHSNKIFIGSDGWLYQPGFFDAEIEAERAGDAEAERVHQAYLYLAQYLADRNIRFVVINNPDKETIYPQYLPKFVPDLPKNSRYQRMRSWLKSRSELIYIDGEDVLQHDCPGYSTFYKLDIHMTFPGGVCFAREFVTRIAKAEGRDVSPWNHTFTYTRYTSQDGGQSDFLALLVPVTQQIEAPDSMFGVDDPAFSSDPSGIFDWVYRAPAAERADRLPAVVLFGDSFLHLYRAAGFFTYFADVYHAENEDTNLATVVGNLPAETRYFVFQFLEPSVNSISFYKMPGGPDR
jgi:alginate O-acetyltransferase complex protein AlgJ